MKTLSLLCSLVLLNVIFCRAQNPYIRWENTLGSPSIDKAYSIDQTSDSGFVVVGGAESNGGDVEGCHGTAYDYWIVKLDNHGKAEWAKCYGGTTSDLALSVKQTREGDYIVAGQSASTDGDVVGHHYRGTDTPDDVWIVKLDNKGNMKWATCYGGTGEDQAYDIEITSDEGYIVAGYTSSKNGDIKDNDGGGDCWIIKLDVDGKILWEKTYGGTSNDYAESIKQLNDGGYIFAAYSYSDDDDVTHHHGKTSTSDYWIVRIDSIGNVIWQKSFGGTDFDIARSIAQTKDGKYFLIAGQSNSSDGDVTGNHGDYDYWIIKIDDNGKLINEISLGGKGLEIPKSIKTTSSGGFVVAGYSDSHNGDITGNHGDEDYWIVKLSSNLILKNEISLGGSYAEEANDLVETAQKDIVIAGSASSTDGDVTGLHNSRGNNYDDYWVVWLKHSVLSNEDEDSIVIRINELRAEGFSIHPTISPGIFKINLQNLPEKNKSVDIEVFTAMGQLVLSRHEAMIDETFQTEIQLNPSLPDGMYFIKAHSDDQQYTGKVLLERMR